MKKTVFLFMIICLFLVISGSQKGIMKSWAQENEEINPADIPDEKPEGMSEEDWWQLLAKKPLPYDKGPSTIDIASYSTEMQDIYTKVYTPKCSKCHTIARAINAPYALPDEWMSYIKKMMKKPGSGINPKAAKSIYAFCVYDSEIRKKDLIEQKLKEKQQADAN